MIVTRDVTESCVVVVEANNESDALDLAVEKAHHGEVDVDWEIDEDSCGSSPAYVTSVNCIKEAVGLTREQVEAMCPQASGWTLPAGLMAKLDEYPKGPDDDYPLDGLKDLDERS
jgi:hypothetical protein